MNILRNTAVVILRTVLITPFVVLYLVGEGALWVADRLYEKLPCVK